MIKLKNLILKNIYLGIITFLVFATPMLAKPVVKNNNFTLEQVYSGERAWSMVFLNENQALITGFKTGDIYLIQIYKNTAKLIRTFALGLNIESNDQAGLLDIALHPNFKENNYIYFTYSKKLGNRSALTLGRATFINNEIKDVQDLYQTPIATTPIHYSGSIAFGLDGKLYLSSGERYRKEDAQKLNTPFGKILRLNLDGSIPKDNPFYKTPNSAREIYTLGHRNAQGLVFDSSRNLLFSTEHGPKGGDELNIIEKGQNYGWPVVTLGVDYDGTVIGIKQKDDMKNPIFSWVPSIATSSLIIYKGDKFSQFRNKILIGALKFGTLVELTLNEDNKVIKSADLLNNEIGRIRNIKESPDGYIYLLDDSGGIYKLTP